MSEILTEDILSRFESCAVSYINKNRMVVNVAADDVVDLLQFLKERGYNYLALMSCVDWIEEGEFELVYQIGKIVEPLRIMVKTRISREKAEFKTVMHIFKNAQVYEREIHELFGIYFDGNDNLTHLFLEDWQKYFPFRKDFDSRKYVKETFESITAPEDGR